ncbi:glycoside hydrolase family 125 protein [Actinotalea ferrariae]|uniref:glycoside hydrolase family 125 protein n=1 Tax=Actinotalea ferrariae TaxID=1386098 RepID=UPI001C8B9AAE|nr:glycoside hydrolase family 125 protein [Actinotalea ferrariae]MBX9243862.1 glycoside hydrolase family 125 protein [Actinotalea ferrariae]
MALYDRDACEALTAAVTDRLGADVGAVFRTGFFDTLDRTVTLGERGAFVITGDIPAMWLRDSTAQLGPYLHLAGEEPLLAATIGAVVTRQLDLLLSDPYANAFNDGPTGAGHQDDLTDMGPGTWERKYEVDSLCYPLQLAYDLWAVTGRVEHLARFAEAARLVIAIWRTEQDHEQRSTYAFQRLHGPASDTLTRDGRGGLVAPTGLTWSAFRPSDDACALGYNVPGNAFAAVVLGHVATLARDVLDDDALAGAADELRREIETALAAHAVVRHDGELVYAYEVDGLGGANLMDDANVPSLLSLPLIGWCAADDPLYLATRALVLSPANPYFYEGTAARGIGSPHTPAGNVWPIALAVQGLTATDEAEKARLLELLVRTDGGAGRMHESFTCDDPTQFTRPWFSWADSMFCELALDVAGLRTYRRTSATGGVRA